MKRTWKRIAAVALCMSILMTGCAKGGGSQTENNQTEGSTTEGAGSESDNADTSKTTKDVIHIAMHAVPDSLDVHLLSDQLARIIGYGMIWESLMTMTEEYIPKPELAESCEVNEDCTEYTYHLRKGVLFHDGQEMKADDVVASMNRWIDSYGSVAEMVGDARFEKVDDYTVKIATETPALFLNELIAAQSQCSAIMPETVINEVDESTGFIKEY